MSARSFLVHDPVHKRWFATDLFCEAAMRELFADCVRDSMFPSVRDGVLVFVDVPAGTSRSFELLRNFVISDRGIPSVRVPSDRLAIGADFFRAH